MVMNPKYELSSEMNPENEGENWSEWSDRLELPVVMMHSFVYWNRMYSTIHLVVNE